MLPILLVVVFGVQSAATAQERPPTPYGVLYKEWKAEVQTLDGETSLTKQERREGRRKINARYMPRFRQLAQEHLDDETWVKCLIWMTVEGVPGPHLDAMFDLLRDNAIKLRNEPLQLQLLMSEFIALESETIDPALSELAEKYPHEGLRGAALYALAARTKRHAEEAGDAAECARAERLLERVIAEYPKVSTYRGENSENATRLLEDLRGPAAITKPAPPTRGVTISGAEFDLSDAIRDKVAVISFSGHWCGPCVAMHPVQKEILARFPRDSVVIVEMNSDAKESLDKVREKVAVDKLNWIMVSDGSSGPTAEQWRVTAWPTYFVIDPAGKIRRRVSGNVGRQLMDWVEELQPKSEL